MFKQKCLHSAALSDNVYCSIQIIFFEISGTEQLIAKRPIDKGGACGVMVIVAGIEHGDTSSNPGLITFRIALIPLGKV